MSLEAIQELIRRHVDLDDCPEPKEAAREVLGQMEAEQVRVAALEMVAREIVKMCIRERRKVERHYDTLGHDRRVEARMLLARETVCLPDGTRVRFGEMTAVQHEQRAEWFAGKIVGYELARTRHLEAAADIRAAGVRCLDELALVTA